MLNGRPGPVWLDIPGDVASTFIETDDLEGFDKQGYIDEHWASLIRIIRYMMNSILRMCLLRLKKLKDL